MAERLDTGGFSHKGARLYNEDALLLCDDLGLFVVADGVGGSEGGDIASGIVCATLEARLRAGDSLTAAMDRAHTEVLAAGARDQGVKGSASTAVAVRVTGTLLQLAWVGDSRAYLWDGELQLLTKDHSLTQDLVDIAQLAFADMEDHPDKNIITQALGSRNGAPLVACKRGHLHTPSVLMLCSDGVSGELSADMMAATLGSTDSAQECARTLVESAVQGGGEDNATCIVIRLPQLPAPPTQTSSLAFMRYGSDKVWHLAAAKGELASPGNTDAKSAAGSLANATTDSNEDVTGSEHSTVRNGLLIVLGAALLAVLLCWF